MAGDGRGMAGHGRPWQGRERQRRGDRRLRAASRCDSSPSPASCVYPPGRRPYGPGRPRGRKREGRRRHGVAVSGTPPSSAGAGTGIDAKVDGKRASPLSDGALRHKRATPAMSGNGRRAKISTKFTTFLLCGMAAHRRVNSPCALVQWVRKLLNFPFPSLGPALGPFAAARAERWSMGSRSADRATGTVVGGAFVVLAPTGVKALNRWTDGCNHRLGELAYVWMVHGSRFGFATTLRRFGVPFGPGLEPRFLGAHHPPSERSLQRRVPFGARPGVTLAPGKGAARRGRGRKSRKSCR
jgi:hypothetical protein